ncbi:MAG: YdbL family protein [Hyphomonadaceae bacterium]|nr:YdbL family protein [Hyphomonadaceae bacterium]MBC6411490.1 YdbL family protein [Hyphomonadaceae bacterium]
MKSKTVFLTLLGLAVMGCANVIVVATLTPQPAFAQTGEARAIVDRAIRDGLVGETATGYLQLVTGAADPKIVNAMNEVNIRRKSVYTELARRQNVQVKVVAALAGEKQIAKASRGDRVLTKEGRWVTVQ